MAYKNIEDQRRYWREWYHRNKESVQMNRKYTHKYRERNKNFVTRYKTFCGCKVCGEKEPVVLDCHHLRDKDQAIALGMRAWSLKRLKTELRKCVILCANCHRKLHAGLITLSLL